MDLFGQRIVLLKELGGQYDLICVDGDHRYEYVKADLDNSIKFKPKVIIIDDYNHRYNFEEREDQYGVKGLLMNL